METIRGTLLASNQGQLVIRTGGGVRLAPQQGAVVTLADAKGLVTRPTLVWTVDADRGGERPVRTTYQAGGITSRADYTLVLDDANAHADLGAWVTLLNVSGAAYENARLKLVAGDVQRIDPNRWDISGRARIPTTA